MKLLPGDPALTSARHLERASQLGPGKPIYMIGEKNGIGVEVADGVKRLGTHRLQVDLATGHRPEQGAIAIEHAVDLTNMGAPEVTTPVVRGSRRGEVAMHYARLPANWGCTCLATWSMVANHTPPSFAITSSSRSRYARR